MTTPVIALTYICGVGKGRGDSWDMLASKKWIRMEGTGHVDDEGRVVLKRVDLMEKFFENVHGQIRTAGI